MSEPEKLSSQAGESEKKDTNGTLSAHQKETIRYALVASARQLIGIAYVWGAEWTDYSLIPDGLDCSEMVEGVYKQNGLRIPDGSQAQFDFTIPTGKPQWGDLCFFGKSAKITQIYHVGMIFDDASVIECRGYQPESSFPTGKVILRPRIAWENYHNFTGYRSHPKII